MKEFYKTGLLFIALVITQLAFPQKENAKLVLTGEQQIEFSEGYGFVSSRIMTENPDMQDVLQNNLQNLEFVRNSKGFMLQKIGPIWVNNIGDWINTEGYLFKMSTADNLLITGDVIDPQTPIELSTGYQIIGYLPSESLNTVNVFEDVLDNLEFVRNTAGFMFQKIGPVWVNNIGDMQPGEGYLVKMNADDVLIYPPTNNQPPEPPSSPDPEDGAENQSIENNISWACTDPEGDQLTYDVYFGTEATPPQMVIGQIETTYNPGILENETEYYWKIVAHDTHENTTEGSVWSFTTESQMGSSPPPCPGIPTVTYEGQVYYTVLIGNQCWFQENLNVGTMISGFDEMTDNGVIEKYCYNSEPANCETYGGLYQWNEIMEYTTISGVKGICPAGWHIPNDDEWKILEGTVDSQYPIGDPIWNNIGYRGFDAGKNLKSTTGWSMNNGTDSFGFTALPGGKFKSLEWFTSLGIAGHFWSSDQFDTNYAWQRLLTGSFNEVGRQYFPKFYAFSVRCIKD